MGQPVPADDLPDGVAVPDDDLPDSLKAQSAGRAQSPRPTLAQGAAQAGAGALTMGLRSFVNPIGSMTETLGNFGAGVPSMLGQIPASVYNLYHDIRGDKGYTAGGPNRAVFPTPPPMSITPGLPSGAEAQSNIMQGLTNMGRAVLPSLPSWAQTGAHAAAAYGPDVASVLPLAVPAARMAGRAVDIGQSAVRGVGNTLERVVPGERTPAPGSNPNARPAARGADFGADSASAARVGTQSRIEQLPAEERAEAERIQAQHGGVNPDALERRVDASTLPVPITLTEGQATRDPMLWDNEFNSRKANPEITERFGQQEQALKDNLVEIRDQAAPGVPKYPAQQGQIALDTDKGMDAEWRQLITSKYQRLEAEAGTTGTFPIDGPGFARNTDAALSGAAKNYAQFLPASVRSMIEGYREGGATTFGQFESDRTILANEARAAERAGNGNAAHAIGVVRDELENVPLPPEYAHLKGLANDARAEAKARFDYIRDNPSYKAAVNDPIPQGQASPLADNYMNTYVISGKEAHVANMNARWADQPQAQAAVAGATIDHVTSQAAIRGGEGTFAPTGYNKALLGLGLKVRDMVSPETAEQLEQLGRVAHYTKVAPGGSLPNRSGTFVGQAGAASNSLLSNIWHLGLKGAEGFLNVKAGGIPVGTAARWLTGTSEGAMEGRAAAAMEQARQAEVARVLRPGAGLEPREAAAGPSGPASTPGSSPPPPPPGFTVDSQGNATPTGRASPPPPTGHAPPRPGAPSGGPPPPTQGPAPAPAASPRPSVPPAGPSAAPAAAGAPPPPSAGPRSRAPSPGIQATTARIAQMLEVPESAVDGRVRALTTQIERAQRLHGEAHTDAEREFHQDMITSMEKERDAVVQRNILATENPKGGRPPPPAAAPSPVPPAVQASAARTMAPAATRSEPVVSEGEQHANRLGLTDPEVDRLIGPGGTVPPGMSRREYAGLIANSNPVSLNVVRGTNPAADMAARGWSQADLERMGAATDAARKQQYEATKQPGESYEDWLERIAQEEERRQRGATVKPKKPPNMADILAAARNAKKP